MREEDILPRVRGEGEEARGAPVIFEYLENLLFAVVAVLLLCSFVFRLVRVDGQSMVPTLQDRDLLVSTHLFYTPQRGDIVVVTQPNEVAVPLIKRVIATGGDTLDIDYESGAVTLNGEALEEDYVADLTYYRPAKATALPLTVPEGMVFAMGDNRNHSSDSRDARVGLIDARYIMGRTVLRLFPLDQIGVLKT